METKPLTGRQKQILAAIKEHIMEKGKPPTIREIGDRFGFASSTIFQHLGALEKKGVIRRAEGSESRGIEIVGLDPAEAMRAMKKIPILGRVAAGLPILAEENIEDYVYVNADSIRGDGTFALTVKGDSMTGAGILDGDLIIVRSQSTANPGDIVVALIEDEATVKRLVTRGGKMYLKPENEKYALMPVTRYTAIIGKVVCVQRMLE